MKSIFIAETLIFLLKFYQGLFDVGYRIFSFYIKKNKKTNLSEIFLIFPMKFSLQLVNVFVVFQLVKALYLILF